MLSLEKDMCWAGKRAVLRHKQGLCGVGAGLDIDSSWTEHGAGKVAWWWEGLCWDQMQYLGRCTWFAGTGTGVGTGTVSELSWGNAGLWQGFV